MDPTAERYVPSLAPSHASFEPFISYEHWHRYLYATAFVAGKEVLDIASGEGYGSHLLAQSAASVLGVDVAADAVAHAALEYVRPNLQFLRGSASEIPVEGRGRFDAIVSFETIEHLSEADQERFAAEVARLLRPGGTFLTSTPNRLLYGAGAAAQNPHHLCEFSPDEFDAFLRARFRHVRLLSQRVFPASYIWNLSDHAPRLSEYCLGLENGEFRPVGADRKETLYLLAVCSDGPLPEPDTSLLIDLSRAAFEQELDRRGPHRTSLYLDTGAGFREEEVVRKEARYGGPFRVAFELDGSPVGAVRWDPLELRVCRLRLERAEWTDGSGAVHPIDPTGIAFNGTTGPDGWTTFDTLDPTVTLPVTGEAVTVEVEGQCEILPPDAAYWRLAAGEYDRNVAHAGRLEEVLANGFKLRAEIFRLETEVARLGPEVARLEPEVARLKDELDRSGVRARIKGRAALYRSKLSRYIKRQLGS